MFCFLLLSWQGSLKQFCVVNLAENCDKRSINFGKQSQRFSESTTTQHK